MLLWEPTRSCAAGFHDTGHARQHGGREILEKQGVMFRQSQVLGTSPARVPRSGATNFMLLHMVGDRDTETVKTKKAKKEKSVSRSPHL